MKNLKFYTFLLLLLGGTVNTFAQMSLEQALRKAKSENKLVFVDCYFTGCIPCEKMDQDVFPNAAVKKALDERFVTLKVNVFTEKLGDTLKVQHIMNGFPTFLVINGDGRLVLNTSGYKDPGDLILLLNEASGKAAKGAFLNGYATTYDENMYPAIYTEYAKTRKGPMNKEALAEYSKTVKDFKANSALLPFLIARTSNADVAAAILSDYTGYVATYGEDILQPVVDKALLDRLGNTLNSSSTATEFEAFISREQKAFPAEAWKVCRQTLSERYFLGLKKDTTAYLQYQVKYPVVHNFHITALHNSMLMKKQLNPERLALFAAWAKGAITGEHSMDLLEAAANMCKASGDKAGQQKFLQMALAKAKKYQMPYADIEAKMAK